MEALQNSLDDTKKLERDSFLNRLSPAFVRNARLVFKQEGLRGVVRRYGWKVFLAFFCYYLIRDSILYILLPYLVARGFIL